MANRDRAPYSRVALQEESTDLDGTDADFRVSRKWNSRYFDVSRKQLKETDDGDLSEYIDVHIYRRTRMLIIPFFVIIISGVILAWLLAIVDTAQSFVALLIIIGLTWLASFVGMIGAYKWGTIFECIQFFSQQNDKYEQQIEQLNTTKNAVKQEAKLMHYEVGKLKQHGKDLEMHLQQFDELRVRLEKTAGQNQMLSDMLDEVNKQIDDLHRLIFEHERAYLLSVYYECSFRDDRSGLSKQEYDRFLARLNKSTRHEFELQGGFSVMDRDGNGSVDLNEFMDMIHGVLEST
eukprot:CAMPEP_0202692298 /NCGR_PEP_ID=MMETSP1385-20130828/6710_1 /ASSEMBLY_ACC=CAM_ASM_000861 /TAXON_ID=933848 /ORGANISM="Elphidium margaritaceum" /LENGTH=291 /DNA_ID=CAMNT_0049347803 /DNA_START=8 /DNA_END=879 /DNA_ORIENTATION=+